jgi:Type IV secretory pathway, VirB6 components
MNPESACLFCGVFTDLYGLAFGSGNGGFARKSFDALVGPSNALARTLATFLVVWTMLQFMLYEEASREILKRMLKLFAILSFVGFFLSRGGGTWLFETVIVGMQTTGLSVAQTIIGKGVDVCTLPAAASGGGGTYAALWAGVECVGFTPVRTAAENWARLSGLDAIKGLADIFAWGLLAFPYLFVLGVFGAFLIQAMFYFLALSGTAPVIMLFMVFDSTRGIVWAGLKFLLTGALTIVFAGMAMGFTGFVLSKYAGNVAKYQAYAIGTSNNTCFNNRVQQELAAKRNPFADEALMRSIAKECDKQVTDAAAAQAEAASAMAADKICSADHFVCTKSYWAAFLIGLMSVLLHLLAPKIAANLSGASDSAATAATVVGAGQFAAAKMLGWSRNSADWAAGTAGRTLGLALGRTGLGGAAQSLASTFGSGGAREQVQQARMLDSINQLSLGINTLNQNLAKRGDGS